MFDDGAELPALIATILRPWASAVETASLGMGEIVTAEASNSASSLRRRVKVTPALDLAITEAVAVSALLASALDHRQAGATEPRAAAMAALAKLAGELRSVEPSESTRALGLGW